MHARTTIRGLQRATSWRSRCAAGASFAVVLSLATLASSATPSFASSHLRYSHTSNYCKLLSAYNKKQTAANKALETPGSAVAAMEAAYKNLKNEENLVLGVAPSSLQSSYKAIFTDINVFYADLSKVHFNYLKLSKAQIASFEHLSKSMSAASAKITAYDKNVCGVKY
jgi:hypothetical protein